MPQRAMRFGILWRVSNSLARLLNCSLTIPLLFQCIRQIDVCLRERRIGTQRCMKLRDRRILLPLRQQDPA